MSGSNTFTARRAELEAKIYDLIALLDLLDGDPDLEDDEREPEETDQNGDEGDYSPDPDSVGGIPWNGDGSGVTIAKRQLRQLKGPRRRRDLQEKQA